MALKKSYRLLRQCVKLFTPKVKTVWEVPYDGGPAVFCPNHARAWGPIDMCVYFPLWRTVRPWYNAGVADRERLPAYIRNDNWWDPKSPLAPLYDAVIPRLGALVMPPVIHSTPGIPVYYDAKVYTTFKQSVEALKNGDQPVIFAQYPDGYRSHSESLSRGFVLLAPLAWRKAKLKVKFYPVHVDQDERTITVMAPVEYDPDAPWEEEQQRLLDYLGERVKD